MQGTFCYILSLFLCWRMKASVGCLHLVWPITLVLISFLAYIFPIFLCRCRQWVQNTRRVDLRNITPLYLSTNCRLCSEHFELEQFSNKRTKNRLNWNAVPTIFKVPNAPKLLSSPRRPLDLHWPSLHLNCGIHHSVARLKAGYGLTKTK